MIFLTARTLSVDRFITDMMRRCDRCVLLSSHHPLQSPMMCVCHSVLPTTNMAARQSGDVLKADKPFHQGGSTMYARWLTGRRPLRIPGRLGSSGNSVQKTCDGLFLDVCRHLKTCRVCMYRLRCLYSTQPACVTLLTAPFHRTSNVLTTPTKYHQP